MAAGFTGGLAATAVMTQFQSVNQRWNRAEPQESPQHFQPDSEPATVKTSRCPHTSSAWLAAIRPRRHSQQLAESGGAGIQPAETLPGLALAALHARIGHSIDDGLVLVRTETVSEQVKVIVIAAEWHDR
jgi:hypothetical protein